MSLHRALRLAVVSVVVSGTGFSTAFAQESIKPGPEHALLKAVEGEWNAEVAFGQDKSKATATYKMTCGGLWLVSDFQGEFGGMTFQGHGIDGFDPEKKKFVSVWVDSWTTTPMSFEGTLDEKTKTITSTAMGKGPDGQPAKYKSVTEHTDKDHHTFKMYLVGPDGADNLMMTIEYTRKK
jgi:hypothetical protein